jgi:serine/threonine-protein kinase HipA
MEVTTLQLAARCGIDAPSARIAVSDGRPVALIIRFDRGSGRRPFISAQSFLDAPDAVSGTYVDLADQMRRFCDDPRRDVNELFRRVAFTILVSNVDDHLKNHGFLHVHRGRWRLSPVFDVNPAPERHRELKTHISDASGSTASIEALIDHADYFEISEDDAVGLISDMADTIRSGWRDLARSNGLSSKDISDYRPAFEHSDMEFSVSLGDRVPPPGSRGCN